MPDFRRYRVEGASYFFTVVTDGRAPFLCHPEARRLLRRLLVACAARWPFITDAIILLPDHLHAVWTLPAGDANYSRRWGWVKKEFTKGWLASGGNEQPVSPGRVAKRRHGVFQPRFWEHAIRDDTDFANHLDYIHYNPVKHGYAVRPGDWPWSSFHRWVEAGAYPPNWGAAKPDLPWESLSHTAGE